MRWSILKISSSVALNLTLFGYALHCNEKYQRWLEGAKPSKKRELAVRDFALREDPYYRSEVPFLRVLAIRNYEENSHLKVKANFQYEQSRCKNKF